MRNRRILPFVILSVAEGSHRSIVDSVCGVLRLHCVPLRMTGRGGMTGRGCVDSVCGFSVAVRATATSVTVRAGHMRSLISHRPNSALCCLENAVFVLRLHCVSLRMTRGKKGAQDDRGEGAQDDRGGGRSG
jgi:hypothetical protein